MNMNCVRAVLPFSTILHRRAAGSDGGNDGYNNLKSNKRTMTMTATTDVVAVVVSPKTDRQTGKLVGIEGHNNGVDNNGK